MGASVDHGSHEQFMDTASRSTFGLIRTLTIPIIITIDSFSGVAISGVKIFAMILMFASAAWLYRNHGIERRGSLITLFTAVNAAITISLFKIILNMGTSVVAAQIILISTATIVLSLWAFRHTTKKKINSHANVLTLQSLSYGLAAIIGSYALVWAPASIVTTASRAADVLWSIVFGKAVFHERHVREKIFTGAVIAVGLIILAFGP